MPVPAVPSETPHLPIRSSAPPHLQFPVPSSQFPVPSSCPAKRRTPPMTKMNFDDLVAFDVHTHAEVSCRQPADEYGREFDEAAMKYFKSGARPTIAETIAYYRERKTGFVMFAVDAEF